jgi:hypothetical protein
MVGNRSPWNPETLKSGSGFWGLLDQVPGGEGWRPSRLYGREQKPMEPQRALTPRFVGLGSLGSLGLGSLCPTISIPHRILVEG